MRLPVNILLSALLFLGACGDSTEKSEGSEASSMVEQPKPQYGKIKEVSMDPLVDKPLAEKGKKIFGITCKACHKYDERYVGPPLGTVYKRRTPVYIMNMILDTETMIKNDDTVKCLLQQYLTQMPNMQVAEPDARAVLEHLRDVSDIY